MTTPIVAPPVRVTCAESPAKVPGSIHAEVAYDVTMMTPKTKSRQSYQCGTSTAVAFHLDYANADDAHAAASGLGGQLWGSFSPHGEDADELLTKGANVVIVSGSSIEPLAKKFEDDGFVRFRGAAVPRAVDAEIAKAVDCGATSKDPLRAFCPVASSATSGFSTPPGPKTFVGIMVAVKEGADLKAALGGKRSVSALSLGPGRVKLTAVTPDNPGEQKQLDAVAQTVATALGGGGSPTLSIGKDLATFLDGRASDLAISGHPVSASTGVPASYKGENPSEISLVHGKVDAYVVIEHASDGTWIHVFPARPYGP